MKAISILISAALITSACAQNDEIFLKETKLPDNEAVEFVNRLGLGWNLGNQMDAVNNGSRAIGNEGFGFINHSDGSFISDGSEAAIKALIEAFTGKSTLSGIYKQAPVTD